MPARSPLDHLRLLRGGLDAHGEAVPLGQEQPVSTRARKQPALEAFGQVEGVAHGADGRRVLLKQELEQGKMITVTVAVAAKPNTPATGAPTITGTAQVGQTLTAATSGISDADGLGTFSYQWIRVDSGADADISGATSSTYTLVAADQGKTIKVKVSFTDDASNAETLTSAATSPVTAARTVGHAQTTEVWSATLTSANSWAGSGSINYDGYGSDASQYIPSNHGSLSPNSFTIGATTHKVEWLAVRETGDQALFFFTDTKLGRNELAGYFLEFIVNGVKKTLQVSDATAALDGSEVVGLFWRHAVHGYGASDWQTKTISVRLVNTDDCANNTTTTCSVSPVSSVTGDIEVASDVDYFRLSVTSGLTYHIDLEGSPTSMGTLANPFIRLRDATVNSIDSDDNGGTGLNARLTWTADRTGTVYLLASENSRPSETGTYTLTVSVGIPDCGRSHWDRNKSLATQLLDASCEYQARSRNILADGQVSAQELAEIRPLVRRLREIVDDLPCGSGPHRYYDPAGEQDLYKGPPPECLVRTTKSGGGGLPWNEILLSPASQDANSPATGAPSISGTTHVGETLTADVSGISDADGLANAVFSYQWQADAVDIPGATGSTYTLTDADEGKVISVAVTFTDDAGNEESLTSAATAAAEPQANTPATGALAITGAARVGETLAANTSGIADEDGLENAVFSYQWQAGGADISGATDSTYTLVDDDAGKAVSVAVSFTDDDGNEETLTGAAGTVPADDYTVNEIWGTGNWGRVTVGGSATGVVEKPGDRDFFGVNLSRGRTYRIDVAGHGDVGALEQVRLYGVFVYAEDLECSGAYDDPGVTTYVLTAEHSAPHSVAVRAEGDGTGVYRVSVSESDDTGTGCDTAPVAAAQAANTPATGAPVITGTVRVGETLTAGTSVIADEDGQSNAVYSYQWQADGAEISSATGSAYTLAGADKGKAISVKVSFSDDAGNAETLTSEPTGAVEAKPNSPATGAPAVTGTAKVGETLTADTSGIADADGLDNVSFTYQWLAGDADIQDATASTYTPVVDDMGKAISVTVSFSDDAGNAESLTGEPTGAVEPGTEEAQAANSPATGLPTISDTAQMSETLTADRSGIADADGLSNAVYSYQWQADGADIPGATSDAYTVAEADEGKAVSVTVTFTDDAGNAESLTSAATAAVEAKANNPATGLPAITGTAQVGVKLTADLSGIVDLDGVTNATPRYQWQADGVDIPGETLNCYTPDDADEGKTISVRVTFTDDAGHEETLTSAATAAVEARPNRSATGALTIIGTARVGELLTADVSEIADADGLDKAAFAYQWQAGSTDLSGATDSSYTLATSDEGKAISVTVSFTDGGGNEESLASAATGAVEAKSNSPATGQPAIIGTALVGETLTADTSGIADEDGLDSVSYSYQWISNDGSADSEIGGATGSTYILASDDVGKTIKVRVSFTDDRGHREELTSAATDAVAGLPPPPLTASLENVATSHDGENVFTFELRFSEEFGISYKTLRDHAFTVTGGTVRKAQRLEQGSNIGWRITVRPNSDGQVTITLPITEDCDAQGAICTEDGRMLSTELELTVSGP